MLSPLLILCPIRLRLPDVCGLGSLIATTEQEENRWATLGIVHAIPRAVVNPEFPDTTAHRVSIARIAETQAVNADTNAGTGSGVTQPQ
jgi:hypothetical protein